ncbi:MAG: response regulator [Anaerolineales bacterium]|nr:response regulator [Anaerolineales bacterium]
MTQEAFALIVEDDEDLAEIFNQALTAANYATEIVRDGQAAQQRLAEVVPAVVTLDMHIPHISGDQILKQIRADERLKKTRVIVTTADELMAEATRGVADLVLIKPITYSQLRDLSARLRPRETSG